MRRTLVVLTLLLASCAGSPATEPVGDAAAGSTTTMTVDTADTMATTTTSTVALTRIDHDAGTTEIAGTPSRIAALSSVHVEMLFAIGAGDQVIAGDLFSDYPEAAGELIKVDSFNLNVEEIIALEPDLVTLSFDPGGVVDALGAVGVPTLLLGTAPTIDAAYQQIDSLGKATGHTAEAAQLVEGMAAEITSIANEYRPTLEGMSFYHEVDSFSFYTPNSSSFIGQFYELLGMVNIADEAPDEFSSGFPQLAPEFIVESDPFVVILASFDETPESLSARDGWAAMSAVQEGRVILLDSDAAGRWGPRIVDVFREIAESVEQLLP